MWLPPLLKNISNHRPSGKDSSIIIFSAVGYLEVWGGGGEGGWQEGKKLRLVCCPIVWINFGPGSHLIINAWSLTLQALTFSIHPCVHQEIYA